MERRRGPPWQQSEHSPRVRRESNGESRLTPRWTDLVGRGSMLWSTVVLKLLSSLRKDGAEHYPCHLGSGNLLVIVTVAVRPRRFDETATVSPFAWRPEPRAATTRGEGKQRPAGAVVKFFPAHVANSLLVLPYSSRLFQLDSTHAYYSASTLQSLKIPRLLHLEHSNCRR